MGELANIAKSRTPYLTLQADESVVATYKGFKMIPDSFNPEKEKFRFLFLINGEIKYLDTGSNKLAMALDEVSEGGLVKIWKYQSGTKDGKPKYSWAIEEVASEDGEVSKKAAQSMNEEMMD